jgi:hypothetical protein
MNLMLLSIQVNESIAQLTQELYDTKLREMDILKFFSILLKHFIVISGIDTKRWMIFQFATVLKMICCPGSSYEIYHPDKVNHNILDVLTVCWNLPL